MFHRLCCPPAGNAYFVEDGIETKNIITHNLGANTRQSFAGLTVDQTPATYWFVNPDNYVASNIASGSTHYGFWFFPEPKVRRATPSCRATTTRAWARGTRPVSGSTRPTPT